MKIYFPVVESPPFVKGEDWQSATWQLQNSLKTEQDFSRYFILSDEEKSYFLNQRNNFKVQVTPYYACVANLTEKSGLVNPIRSIFLPTNKEYELGLQQMDDPLGENQFSPTPQLIHRYPDRVLLLVTDVCAAYCRYCTRKYYTAKGKPRLKNDYLKKALAYISQHQEIREVILSGGDPLILDDSLLESLLTEIRAIDHVEIIRIGTRVPVVNPMRITEYLAKTLRKFKPLVVMTHFNHPKEVTDNARLAIDILVDQGLMVMNQMVLLNGVNNHPAIVQALSRRLLYLGVKPYAMYQCDPSMGTDHLRTSIENSLKIVNALWGKFSTLATPQFYVDIPGGGGKVPFHNVRGLGGGPDGVLVGWDGIQGEYLNPAESQMREPSDLIDYLAEWNLLN
jgi:lysine 2,3-aminomutase